MFDYIVLGISIAVAILCIVIGFRADSSKRKSTASRETRYRVFREKISGQLDTFGVSNHGISMDEDIDDLRAYDLEELGL